MNSSKLTPSSRAVRIASLMVMLYRSSVIGVSLMLNAVRVMMATALHPCGDTHASTTECMLTRNYRVTPYIRNRAAESNGVVFYAQ